MTELIIALVLVGIVAIGAIIQMQAFMDKLDAERDKNLRLRKALGFCADASNWNWQHVRYTGGQNSDGSWQEPYEETCTCEQDHGDRARAELEEG